MKKAVTFGEIMLRLSPEGRKRFVQADRFDAVYGGSEANVAIALGNMGIKADFLTALPDSPLGDAAENFVRSFGVNTKGTVRKDGRLGIYFLEKGASQRPSKVVYDREGSVFSRLKEGEIDFKKAFERARLVPLFRHYTRPFKAGRSYNQRGCLHRKGNGTYGEL